MLSVGAGTDSFVVQAVNPKSCLLDHRCLVIKKVKCTLVQALRLCTGCMAHRGSRGIALLFHDQRH